MLVPVASTRRSGRVETRHSGAAAVALPEGRLLAALGDPDYPTWARSAAKPFQALPLLAAGGERKYRLDDADLALICASHGGRSEHVERAASLLERGGFSEADLACGAHPPLDRDAALALADAGARPTLLHNNCSGKHAGMLLACGLAGHPPAGYLEPDHPLQREILTAVAAFCRVEPAAVGIGVDGCSVPTFHLPLSAVARGYAALVEPAAAGVPEDLAAPAARALGAMAAAPEMVAGPGRFTTRLIEVTGGRVVGKEGASGFYAAAVRGPVAFGIALKIADGTDAVRDGVAIDLLRQLGCLSRDEVQRLADFHRPVLRNHRGIAVGEAVPEPFELIEVDPQPAEGLD